MMLEAMANHIFVCATAVDGVTDVVSNETGLLMPENPTVEQLTAFLEMLCSMDKDKFDTRAQMGYECWRDWFNADENCMRFASELSAVENIQPEEETAPAHRTFTSWKPEEKVEVEPPKEEAAEQAETDTAADTDTEKAEKVENASEAPEEGKQAEPSEPKDEQAGEKSEEAAENLPEEAEKESAELEKPAGEAAAELLEMVDKLGEKS